MPTSPIAPATATVATVRTSPGATPLPTNVSFSTQVVPTNLVFRELNDPAVTSTTFPRLDLAVPEKSLVRTMPSAESPPDAHPNVTFTGPNDPDYLTILVWIREGAKQN